MCLRAFLYVCLISGNHTDKSSESQGNRTRSFTSMTSFGLRERRELHCPGRRLCRGGGPSAAQKSLAQGHTFLGSAHPASDWSRNTKPGPVALELPVGLAGLRGAWTSPLALHCPILLFLPLSAPEVDLQWTLSAKLHLKESPTRGSAVFGFLLYHDRNFLILNF